MRTVFSLLAHLLLLSCRLVQPLSLDIPGIPSPLVLTSSEPVCNTIYKFALHNRLPTEYVESLAAYVATATSSKFYATYMDLNGEYADVTAENHILDLAFHCGCSERAVDICHRSAFSPEDFPPTSPEADSLTRLLEEIVTTRSTARMKEYNDRRSALDFRSLARHLQAAVNVVGPGNRFVAATLPLTMDTKEGHDLLAAHVVRMGLWMNPDQRPMNKYIDRLTAKPVWWSDYPDNSSSSSSSSSNDAAVAHVASFLTELYPTIKKEWLAAAKNGRKGMVPEAEGLHEGIWNEIVLMAHNDFSLAPNFQGVKTALKANADIFASKVSILESGTDIRAHTGPSNARLRAHVCLSNPAAGSASQPYMIVGGERIEWQEGKVVIFDDSFEHEVHYPSRVDDESSSERVVLIVDLWHPEVEEGEKTFE
jgi:aspartate beta-hydroxylase